MGEIKTNNPGVAAILSFIFSGLGQIYNGQISKGLLVIFFTSVSLLIFLFGSTIVGLWLLGKIVAGKVLAMGIGLFLVGLIAICVLGVYSIFDAYNFSSRK